MANQDSDRQGWIKRAKAKRIPIARGQSTDSIKAQVMAASKAKHDGLRKL